MTYTREQILAMTVGEELDEVVAIHVMGKENNKTVWGSKPFNPSSDISTAIEAAEKVGTYQLTKIGIGPYPYRAIVKANKHVVNAETAPEAICKASLLAVMGL